MFVVVFFCTGMSGLAGFGGVAGGGEMYKRDREIAWGWVPGVRFSCHYSISPGTMAGGGGGGGKCTIVDVLTFVSCTELERVQLRR